MRILLTLLLFTALPILSQNLNLCEWMKSVPDTTPLCQLSIPGTHDSGALDGGEAFQTQELTIEEQLEAGIRCFDIRLKACDNNLLGVYHSIVFQDAYWETDVLPAFRNFLQEHPSEALIVFIKREAGDTEAFKSLLSTSLNDTLCAPLFIPDFHKDIALGEGRGKILLIHRDCLLTEFPGVQCHGWKDNATCDVTLKDAKGNETLVSVEDEYQFSSSKSASYKVETTWKHLQATQEQAHQPSDFTWHITFASATALPEEGPQAFAHIVNAKLANLTTRLTSPCGILLIDFAGSDDARIVIQNLIQANALEH